MIISLLAVKIKTLTFINNWNSREVKKLSRNEKPTQGNSPNYNFLELLCIMQILLITSLGKFIIILAWFL